MAIKSGQIIHQGREFVIDRIQTAGAGNLNIPEEKIYELGNYETVATVRDIPDLSFDMESFDVSCELEALLTGVDPTTLAAGAEINLDDAVPLDVVSPFKSNGAFDIIRGIALPYLSLERSTYRFGLRQNSTQSHTLRGDSIYYVPGTPRYEEYDVATLVGGAITFTDDPAIAYNYSGDTYYALSIMARNTTTGTYRRLHLGDDYTNTTTGATITADLTGYDTLCVVYGTAVANSYTQTGNNPNGLAVHQNVSVKPAAIRGKDIDVYIGNTDVTPVFSRWTGVQSFEVTRSVNMENDEEFGNPRFVDSSYDTAEVTGSITVKPVDPQDLWNKIHQIANIPANEIVGPYTSVALPVEIRVSNPDTGAYLKTLYIPDARFQVPAVQGRVQQKLETTFNFNSDGGVLRIFNGDRP